ncbi:cold-shock protein [Pseudaeromonas sharmana]|uniref:Cold-shock protein n=1 Tax=Pseudaeromonas sharmana TaxID=328412 RepID=A0ABV8CR12_9GAMM
MHFQGRITDWSQERGYGFIEPHGATQRVYLNVNAFASLSRLPQDGDIVVYQADIDQIHRPEAREAWLLDDWKQRREVRRPSVLPVTLGCISWFVLLLLGIQYDRLPALLPILYLLASLLALFAQPGKESTALSPHLTKLQKLLPALTLLGGWPGLMFARHRQALGERQRLAWLGWLVSINVVLTSLLAFSR